MRICHPLLGVAYRHGDGHASCILIDCWFVIIVMFVTSEQHKTDFLTYIDIILLLFFLYTYEIWLLFL